MGRLFQFASSSSRTASPPPSSRVVKRGRPGDNNNNNNAALHDIPSSPIRSNHATASSLEASGATTMTSSTTMPTLDLTPRRRRCNSREYPRSYSGQYGQGDDLVPLEIQRHGRSTLPHFPTFCGVYLTLVLVVHWLVVMLLVVMSPTAAWTWTHVIHAAASMWWLHWSKGSLEDVAGEMNALTQWEQWEASGTDTRAVREACMVVPCMLCWLACHVADYKPPMLVALNIVLWIASLCPKMPFMNGVRLFGINATTGIDDETTTTTTTTSTNNDSHSNKAKVP